MHESFSKIAYVGLLAAFAPLAMGARGCGPITSTTPAPDVAGDWSVAYDDTLDVTIRIGGAVYDASLPAEGGTVEIEHGGFTIPFTLDCSRPEIVCPSEAWPETVTIEQRDPEHLHQMWVRIPEQVCMGATVTPAENECGPGTLNPDCDAVCDGEVTTVLHDRFGVINEPGERFDLLLGAGIATNGVNCVLLGVSAARADIESVGAAETSDWTATHFTNGEVAVAYGGGCLWAGDPDMDGELEALVLDASVTFRTGFTSARVE
ncbi:MAG: hypothetical protein KC619_26665 [Myxococcales bacterium]|nr:hypothetical protein [Myxococcales bacterium]